MNLDNLYKLQEELDNHIWNKHGTLDKMSKEELLDNTILALLVEVGELANTTRCFKHWSTKGMMEKEIILDELADVWHFYLSIGNQINFRLRDGNIDANNPVYYGLSLYTRTDTFNYLYFLGGNFNSKHPKITKGGYYIKFGAILAMLGGEMLGFTDAEVEQAYLKKSTKKIIEGKERGIRVFAEKFLKIGLKLDIITGKMAAWNRKRIWYKFYAYFTILKWIKEDRFKMINTLIILLI